MTKLVNKKQEFQKVQFDRTRKYERLFDVGDVVKVKNARAQSETDKCLFGSIIDVKGPRNYAVKIGSERKLAQVSDSKNSFLTTVNDSLVNNTAISVNSEQTSLVFTR